MMTTLLLLMTLFPSPSVVADDDDGKLEKFKKPYKEEKSDTPATKADDDDGGPFDWLLEGFLEIPFSDLGVRYRSFPYQRLEGDSEGYPFAFDIHSAWGRVDYDTWSIDLSARARLPSGFFLDASNMRFQEDVEGGDDHLSYSEGYLGMGLLRNRDMQIDVGVGGAGLDGLGGGLALQGSVDCYPLQPFALHGSASWASIEGEDLTDLRFEAGLVWKHIEFAAGWRSLVNSRGDDLSGPTIGMTLRF